LLADLRRVFSGIAGNVKDEGFEPSNNTAISRSAALQTSWRLWISVIYLSSSIVEATGEKVPCYRIINKARSRPLP
jgi:hypothetical protein